MSDRPPMDLGHGVTVTLRDCECRDEAHDHATPCGMTFAHQTPTGAVCDAGSWIWFGMSSGWTLEAVEPLTISPSLLCTRCGTHGFIRAGKWVPA